MRMRASVSRDVAMPMRLSTTTDTTGPTRINTPGRQRSATCPNPTCATEADI
jgi:hypothetical protein